MPSLSNKGKQLPASPIRKLVPYAEQAKEQGVEVLHLNIGQPDIPAPEEAMRVVREQDLKLLPYGTSQGSKVYREKLCSYYAQHNIALEASSVINNMRVMSRAMVNRTLKSALEMTSVMEATIPV